MKYLIYIIAISSICLTQEMEVEGDLKVTGTVQSTTIDSLKQVISDLQSQLNVLQSGVSSKIVSYDCSHLIGNEEYFVPIVELIGQDLQIGLIQFSGFSGELTSNFKISFYSSQAQGLENYLYRINLDSGYQAVKPGSTNYYFDSHVNYISFLVDGDDLVFNGTLYFIVTADFYQESNTLLHNNSGLTKVKN